MGIAGRLPVYLTDASGQRSFWGIVSVTLDFPAVLSGSPVERVASQGFACEVWRINPDTGQRQTILMSETPPRSSWGTVSFEQEMFNADWTITLSPLVAWYARPSLWIYLAIGLLLSGLAAAGTYNLERVRLMQAEAAQRAILQLQTQLEHEQTDMLLSQIRSHFFYHTLNSLQALIVLRPEEAYKMAGDFPATCALPWTPPRRLGAWAPLRRNSGRCGPMRISTRPSWETGSPWSTMCRMWISPCRY